MNCVVRFIEQAQRHPEKMAIWTEGSGAVSFGALYKEVRRAQAMFRARGVGPGDAVLVAALPGTGLFASILALLGLGAPVLLVEPWMPIGRLNHVVKLMRPKVFFSGWIGQLWGLRVPEIRRVPHWASERTLHRSPDLGFHCEDLGPTAPAVVAFSSGTSGAPKGAVRTQQYLHDMHEILCRHAPSQGVGGPDLAVFPNVVLFQLGTGRGAILVPHSWNEKSIARIATLPAALRPTSVTCGPAFLRHLLKVSGLEELKSFHVGGAVTDCAVFEQAFKRWPDAEFVHIYGGSEAEPVALVDARKAVRLSRESGYFQTLFVGGPVAEIRAQLSGQMLGLNDDESIWVAGANVSPEYLGDASQNKGAKVRDTAGTLWHRMGDRIRLDPDGWWFAGRALQPAAEFELEQRIYAEIRHSGAFVERDNRGGIHLFGETVLEHAESLRRLFPEIVGIHRATIIRDRRHRARIDRVRTLAKIKAHHILKPQILPELRK